MQDKRHIGNTPTYHIVLIYIEVVPPPTWGDSIVATDTHELSVNWQNCFHRVVVSKPVIREIDTDSVATSTWILAVLAWDGIRYFRGMDSLDGIAASNFYDNKRLSRGKLRKAGWRGTWETRTPVWVRIIIDSWLVKLIEILRILGWPPGRSWVDSLWAETSISLGKAIWRVYEDIRGVSEAGS